MNNSDYLGFIAVIFKHGASAQNTPIQNNESRAVSQEMLNFSLQL